MAAVIVPKLWLKLLTPKSRTFLHGLLLLDKIYMQLDRDLQINWILDYLNHAVISLKISYMNLIHLICRSKSKFYNIAHCTERKRDLTLRKSTTFYNVVI